MPAAKPQFIDRNLNRKLVPLAIRLILLLLLAGTALFNFIIAPAELNTTGMFASQRQSNDILYGLCMLDGGVAFYSVVILLKNERIKPKQVILIGALTFLLIVVSAYCWTASL